MLTKLDLFEIVNACMMEWNSHQSRKIPLERGFSAPLYDKEGYLDSIGLVSVLISIEQAIEESVGVDVNVANDPFALSQKDSPFKTIGSLVDYLFKQIEQSFTANR